MTTKEYLELYNKFDKATEEEKQAIKDYNRELTNKYPWLVPRNWTGKVVEDYDYEYTELDEMPDGWRIAFGDDLCKELQEELEAANFVNDYSISTIKEKFGSLRWYDFGNTEKGMKIIDKYEKLSAHTCIYCGQEAKWLSKGYILPFCDQCEETVDGDIEFEELQKEIE